MRSSAWTRGADGGCSSSHLFTTSIDWQATSPLRLKAVEKTMNGICEACLAGRGLMCPRVMFLRINEGTACTGTSSFF
jgi:hypothetical protein